MEWEVKLVCNYSSLGFTGGSLLKKKQVESQKQEPCLNKSTINLESVKKSASCPDNLKQDKKHLWQTMTLSSCDINFKHKKKCTVI